MLCVIPHGGGGDSVGSGPSAETTVEGYGLATLPGHSQRRLARWRQGIGVPLCSDGWAATQQRCRGKMRFLLRA